MTKQTMATSTNSLPKRNSTFSLATLICVLTICALLSAWFVDHQRLVTQIAPPSERLSTVYRLSNVSAELATKKLNEWLEPGTVIAETVSNSVIVTTDETNRLRIESMIRYVDRTGTDLVHDKIVVPKMESKALPTSDASPINKAPAMRIALPTKSK